jgi:8-oxo-dGTP pyrophosphatase MutT (NUDIX family)
LKSLVDESNENDPTWVEPEWGFPKGRREFRESDYQCAIREFSEETGYPSKLLHKITNILPYEEIFSGSNYKTYKHNYYLMYMKYEESNLDHFSTFQPNNEIGCIEWKSFEKCIEDIRFYNIEKKEVLEKIHQSITRFQIHL